MPETDGGAPRAEPEVGSESPASFDDEVVIIDRKLGGQRQILLTSTKTAGLPKPGAAVWHQPRTTRGPNPPLRLPSRTGYQVSQRHRWFQPQSSSAHVCRHPRRILRPWQRPWHAHPGRHHRLPDWPSPRTPSRPKKKLLPIRKKLEKEVKNLQQDLQTAETEIRTTAIKQARETQANQPHRRPEKTPIPVPFARKISPGRARYRPRGPPAPRQTAGPRAPRPSFD